MIKVRIWQDSYYPGGYQLKAIRDGVAKKILTRARENGYSLDETTATASTDDLESTCLTCRQWKELQEWGSVIVLMAPWEFAHFYGYDAHTVFEG